MTKYKEHRLDKPDVFISAEKISLRVKELAEKISADYKGEKLTVICVLKGSFIFCADLVRHINIPVEVEFVQVSSYGSERVSSGEIDFKLPLKNSIEGKNVIVVEDIVDTGNTLDFLLKYFAEKKPKTLKLTSLLFKPVKLQKEVKIDYLGFEIEDKYVIGYGLDDNEMYRELPYIGIVGN